MLVAFLARDFVLLSLLCDLLAIRTARVRDRVGLVLGLVVGLGLKLGFGFGLGLRLALVLGLG